MQGERSFYRDSGQGAKEDSNWILIFLFLSFLFFFSASKTTQEIAEILLQAKKNLKI